LINSIHIYAHYFLHVCLQRPSKDMNSDHLEREPSGPYPPLGHTKPKGDPKGRGPLNPLKSRLLVGCSSDIQGKDYPVKLVICTYLYMIIYVYRYNYLFISPSHRSPAQQEPSPTMIVSTEVYEVFCFNVIFVVYMFFCDALSR
jgi:hypothetical protein